MEVSFAESTAEAPFTIFKCIHPPRVDLQIYSAIGYPFSTLSAQNA